MVSESIGLHSSQIKGELTHFASLSGIRRSFHLKRSRRTNNSFISGTLNHQLKIISTAQGGGGRLCMKPGLIFVYLYSKRDNFQEEMN